MDNFDLYCEADKIIKMIVVGALGDTKAIDNLSNIVKQLYDNCEELEEEVQSLKRECNLDEDDICDNDCENCEYCYDDKTKCELDMM